MHIKSIQAPSFGGGDIKVSLTKNNVIVGQPFTGKTSIANAILAGMYGYVPRLGSSNAATLKLSSDPSSLFVRLIFDNDQENQVVIENRDGKTKKTESLPVKFPTVLMDLDEYFEKTGQERLQYVLDRVNLKKAGYDEAKLLNDFTVKGSESNKALMTMVRQTIAQRDVVKTSVSFWMESLLSRLKATEKADKASIKTCEQSILLFKKMPEPPDKSEERQKAHATLVAAEALLDSREDKAQDDLRNQIDACSREINAIKNDINDLEDEENKIKKLSCCPTCKAQGEDWRKFWNKEHDAEVFEASKKLDAERKKQKDLIAKLEALDNASDKKKRQQLQDARNKAQDEYDAIDDAQRERIAWETARDGVVKTRKSLEAATEELQCVKAMIETLTACQSEVVEKAFKTLLTTACLFTNGIMKSPIAYHEGELGRWEKKVWVSHETMSGTEKLLTYSGLQIALCQDAPVKILILDEFNRMSTDYATAVANRMIKLVEDGIIDQFIAICCEDRWINPSIKSKLNVIRL